MATPAVKKKAPGAASVLKDRKVKAVQAAVKRAGVTGSFQRVPVDLIDPNPWNPNVVPPEAMQKLRAGIAEMYRKHGGIPPIITRPHPESPGRFQIIDGEHRWIIVKGDRTNDRLADEIDSFVVDVDDALAKRLTLNLNYLRGTPDEAKEAGILGDLVKSGWTPDELAQTLYMDSSDIVERLNAYDDNEALIEILKQESKGEKDSKGEEEEEIKDDDIFLDLTFKVSGAQAKVIEKEIERIASKLKGRNTRGRALEFAMVQSSQTKLPEDLA